MLINSKRNHLKEMAAEDLGLPPKKSEKTSPRDSDN